eukprot:Gb_34225 [translate_table: standard]
MLSTGIVSRPFYQVQKTCLKQEQFTLCSALGTEANLALLQQGEFAGRHVSEIQGYKGKINVNEILVIQPRIGKTLCMEKLYPLQGTKKVDRWSSLGGLFYYYWSTAEESVKQVAGAFPRVFDVYESDPIDETISEIQT